MIEQIFSDAHLRHYVLINLGVAAGIAVDAMIATLSRFSSFPNGRTILKWGGAIGLTHWLFPLAGFIGGWYAAINVPLSTLIFLFGAAVMAWFVTEVVKSSAGFSNVDEESSDSGIWTSRLHFWAAVWAVSIDALITGPGKTSATMGWTELEVWLSFPIVGIVVFLFVITAASIAKLLYHRYAAPLESHEPSLGPSSERFGRDRRRLGAFFVAGAWFEVCIFSYFGLLAVAQTLRIHDIPVPGLFVFGATAILGICLFWFLHDRVRETQFRRVDLAFGK